MARSAGSAPDGGKDRSEYAKQPRMEHKEEYDERSGNTGSQTRRG